MNIESPGLWTGSGLFNNRGWQSIGNSHPLMYIHVGVYNWIVGVGWGAEWMRRGVMIDI